MQHFKSLLLSMLLLMFCWQTSTAQSDELEYIFTDLQQAFPDCLANYTVNDFADTYELIVFMEQECNIAINDFFPTDGDDWIGGNDGDPSVDDGMLDDNGEWTVADEWEQLVQQMPWCFENTTPEQFDSFEALYYYVNSVCFNDSTDIAVDDNAADDWSDWGGNDGDPSVDDGMLDDGNEWTVADEWALLAEQFPWCFENTTPEQFDTFDALYYYFETACFNDSTDIAVDDLPWDDWGGNDDDPSVDDGMLDDGNEWTVADEWELLAEQFPWCFENTTPEQFDSFEALYIYFESNCLNLDDSAADDWTDWGGNDDDPSVDDGMLDDGNEWTVADEWAILAEQFPWCFDNTSPEQFDTFEALYYYFETACFNDSTDIAVDDLPWDDWGGNDDDGQLDDGMVDDGDDDEGNEGTTGEDENDWDGNDNNDSTDWGNEDDWNWTVEDELMWLQQQFPECLDSVAADMFDGFEALYEYVEANCFNDGPVEPNIPDIPDCVFNIPFDENLGLQDFIITLVDECGDEIDLPACIVDAPAFDSDEDFILYLFENCEMFDGFGLSNPNDGMTVWDNAAQWYNLAPIINNSTSITQLNTLNINLYPNPADNNLNIEVADTEIYTIEIYDISGKLVYSSVARGNNLINISQLNTGIYMLNITNSVGHYSSKLHIK